MDYHERLRIKKVIKGSAWYIELKRRGALAFEDEIPDWIVHLVCEECDHAIDKTNRLWVDSLKGTFGKERVENILQKHNIRDPSI